MDSVLQDSREIIRKGSRSFAAASRFFAPAVRESAWLLYAWCRYCDDQIDGQELGAAPLASPTDRRARLAALQVETRRALAGEPVSEPAFVAFQRVARRHRIPERYPRELLAGLAMDVEDARYHTLRDTLLYCYRVAGVVGVMMACMMGVRDQRALQRAADLGIAFQLTNIARDVMDDARNDRCYLPADWLAEAGVPSDAVLEPRYRPAVARVVGRLLTVADRYYASAGEGLRDLSFRSAWAVATALAVYRDIGRIVLVKGHRAWDRRAVVSTWRKWLYAATGFLRALKAVTVDRRKTVAPRSADLWAPAEQIPEPVRRPIHHRLDRVVAGD
jgi:phytoene synthase